LLKIEKDNFYDFYEQVDKEIYYNYLDFVAFEMNAIRIKRRIKNKYYRSVAVRQFFRLSQFSQANPRGR